MDLATELQSLRPEARSSPLAGFEHVRGYGVFAMPFSSGHVLALRVFPQNDFAPYTSLWHRTPEGARRLGEHRSQPFTIGCKPQDLKRSPPPLREQRAASTLRQRKPAPLARSGSIPSVHGIQPSRAGAQRRSNWPRRR